MQIFLKLVKGLCLIVFAIGSLLSITTAGNFLFDFTETALLEIHFLRMYLFMAVVGILVYILIRFRRKPGE